MAKIKNGSGNPAMRGVGSSIILSFLVLGMLSVVWYWPNYIQKTRDGEGKFVFDEEICFDFSDEKEFDQNWQFDDFPTSQKGKGAFCWVYHDDTTSLNRAVNNKMTMLNFPLNGTTPPYGASVTELYDPADDVDTPNPVQTLYIKTNLTKKDIIENDITRIDVYFDISGVTFDTMTLRMSGGLIEVVRLGNLTEIKITVEHLLQINALDPDQKIRFSFPSINEDIPAGAFVVFDAQFYCIEEIKTLTLDKLAYVNYTLTFILIFVAFIMFGSIRLRDITDWVKTPIGGT